MSKELVKKLSKSFQHFEYNIPLDPFYQYSKYGSRVVEVKKKVAKENYTLEEIRYTIVIFIVNIYWCHYYTGCDIGVVYFENLISSMLKNNTWLQCLWSFCDKHLGKDCLGDSSVDSSVSEEQKQYQSLMYRLFIATEVDSDIHKILWSSDGDNYKIKIPIDSLIPTYILELGNEKGKFFKLGSMLGVYYSADHVNKMVKQVKLFARYTSPSSCQLRAKAIFTDFDLRSRRDDDDDNNSGRSSDGCHTEIIYQIKAENWSCIPEAFLEERELYFTNAEYRQKVLSILDSPSVMELTNLLTDINKIIIRFSN